MKLVIGNKNYSSWSLRPWIFLNQKELLFEEERVPLFEADTNARLAPYFSDYKVPVLVDDGLVVWDSLAILEYLADMYPQVRGWPDERAARAVARSVSAEMHSSYGALRGELPMNCRRTFSGIEFSPTAVKEISRVQELWRHCREHFGQSGPWLFGHYTVADAMFAPVAIRFAGYGIEPQGAAGGYLDTVMADPHLQQWMAAGAAEKEVIVEDEIYP